MKTKIIFSAIILLAFAGCKKEPVSIDDITNNSLQSPMDKEVNQLFLANKNDLNTVGLSIGIYRNDSLFFYGYGETKKGSGVIPDEHTFFEIGSVTKTFTATATMCMLQEEGLSIETPIRKFLPGNLPTLQRGGVEVNFKHLLTHTSGLPYVPDNLGLDLFINESKALREYDENKLFTFLLNVELHFTPFTNWEYSNTAFGLLGNIMERQYNESYAQIIEEKITNPLGLSETKVDLNNDEQLRFADGYNSTGTEEAHWNSLNALNGMGAIKSTAADLIKYCRANLNPPVSNLGIAMIACHQQIYPKTIDNAPIHVKGCLGWFLYTMDGVNGTFLFHNGGTAGFNTDVFINMEKNSALVLLYNTDNNDGNGRNNFHRGLLNLIH